MKRYIARAALAAAALLVAAAPATAQQSSKTSSSNKITVTAPTPAPVPPPAPNRPLEGVQVSYSWRVPGLPGMVPNIGQGNELLEGGPRLKLDQGPPVPVSHLDFGAYEPFIPQLAREALRQAERSRGANP